MNRRFQIAFLASVLVIALIAVLVPKANPYADGPAALAAVAKLRRGMDSMAMARTLHPARVRHSEGSSFDFRHIEGTDEHEQIHGLTADRHLVGRWSRDARRGTVLLSWTIREGRAPREDVVFGRIIQFAGIRIPL